MTVCADCGAEIELIPWADKIRSVKWWAPQPDGSYQTACREVVDWSDADNPRCLAMDYHHVEGEQQPRWRLNL